MLIVVILCLQVIRNVRKSDVNTIGDASTHCEHTMKRVVRLNPELESAFHHRFDCYVFSAQRQSTIAEI